MGKVLDSYHVDRLMIHDVGTLLSSSDGLQPSRCRAEKRIIGRRSNKDLAYNLDRKEIET
jgi:hypothetical protein